MIDDVVEGAVHVAFRGVLVFVRILLEVVLFLTGEIVLWLLTLGRHEVRWDYYLREKPAAFVLLSERSCWVGGFVWIVAIELAIRAARAA